MIQLNDRSGTNECESEERKTKTKKERINK